MSSMWGSPSDFKSYLLSVVQKLSRSLVELCQTTLNQVSEKINKCKENVTFSAMTVSC